MNFDDYQNEAKQFAAYDDESYPFIALAEEVGEFLSFAAKMARGDNLEARYGSVAAAREACLKEAGDVLWQLAQCMTEFEMSLQDAAELNIRKLTDRKERGVIRGSGDNR